MNSDDIRIRMSAQPFTPFTVVTTDGAQIRVHHHDYAWVSPRGGEMDIEDAEGKLHRIYTAHISRLIDEPVAEESMSPAAE